MHHWGFGLLEIMIALVILGILASLAYPGYLQHVERARRAEAHARLLNIAQHLERCHTTNGSYLACDTGAGPDGVIPTESGFYEIRIRVSRDNAFTATAGRVRGADQDQCGNLTLDHRGRRFTRRSTDTPSDPVTDACW